MKLLRFVSFVNEALSQKINESVHIQPKDWERMSKLVLKDDDGYSVAKLIRDKNKAIARFVAGTKLNGEALRYDQRYNEYSNKYRSIGNKALALGATDEGDGPTYYVLDRHTDTVLARKMIDIYRRSPVGVNGFVNALKRALIDIKEEQQLQG